MPKVLIAGAGLVGALNACYFAERGWDVEVYEYRRDIRTMEHVAGRSINLALSQRGKESLERVGLRQYIVDQGVEMHARLVHNKDGKTYSRQPYGQPGEHIVSINRRNLNEVMISKAEKCKNVRFFFEHKVKSVDLEKKELVVQFTGGSKIPKLNGHKTPEETVLRVTGDLIIACDGAYSAVRRSLQTHPRFNETTIFTEKKNYPEHIFIGNSAKCEFAYGFDYSQEYIAHGYIELNILPKNNEYALEPNVFHLWPRGHFTLIALANRDKTFTVTIFAPFAEFEKHMSTPQDVEQFFKENFPDACELLGRDHILDVFRRVRPQPLVSIKCSPHHFNDFVLLTGDAAHAMVPFYGQGMNCGFEDCLVLSETLDKCEDKVAETLREYSRTRVKDAHTINDLAMYNYEELRDLVNHPSYKLRKMLDLTLNKLFPKSWIPLYSMVTFTRTPYHKVVENRKWQDRVLSRVGYSLTVVTLSAIAAGGFLHYKKYLN